MKKNLCIIIAVLVALAATAGSSAREKALLILTTNKVVEKSSKLEEYVEAKEARGFTVRVATESDYGGEELEGQEKALHIREWLKGVYTDYSFLLIIGDAHPKYGDIPMITVWPRYEFPEGQCFMFQVDCRSTLTDYMYSDLSGNWDLNGNGVYGESGTDDGSGGIDFNAELVVGRIPMYFGEVDKVDKILGNALEYMNQPKAETDYRKKILLPAAYYYFKGQEMIYENVDGAEVAEWYIKVLLSKRSDVSYTRMYEKEGVVASQFADSETLGLTRDNLVAEWNNGYGMVFWFGHGLEKTVARVVWEEDKNGDELAQNDELITPSFIESSDSERLPTDKRAFVVGVSCEIGSAEVPENLAYSLLLNGGAVGVVGSASITPGSDTDFSNYDGQLSDTTFGGENLGILFFNALMDGGFAGEAVANAKAEVALEPTVESNAGKMMLNYFGDPSLTINDVALESSESDAGVGDGDTGEDTEGYDNDEGDNPPAESSEADAEDEESCSCRVSRL